MALWTFVYILFYFWFGIGNVEHLTNFQQPLPALISIITIELNYLIITFISNQIKSKTTDKNYTYVKFVHKN